MAIVTGHEFTAGELVTAAKLNTAVTGQTVTATGSTTARSPADRAADVVDVLDYGANNTGTECATAVQAALTAVSGEATVVFPAGTYLINTTIAVPSGVILDFQGSAINTTLNGVLFSVVGLSGSRKTNVTLRDGIFTASSIGTGAQQAVQAQWADNVLISQCQFHDFFGAGVKFNGGNDNCEVSGCYANNIGTVSFYAEADGTATPAEPIDNVRFLNNTLKDWNYGVEAKQATTVKIKGNTLLAGKSGSTKYGILVTRDYSTGAEYVPRFIDIQGNSINGAPNYGINVTNSADVIVSDNIVYNSANTAVSVSGSHLSVEGNVASDVGSSGSGLVVGYADVTTGTRGITDTGYSKAYATITANKAHRVDNISMNFIDVDYSTIMGNLVTHQNSATYAVQFTGSTNSQIIGNKVYGVGGTYSFGYRLSTDSSNCTYLDNAAYGYANGQLSLPSDHLGFYLNNSGDIIEVAPRKQTTGVSATALFTHTLGTNELWSISASVIGRHASYRGAYDLIATVYRASSTAVLQGSVTSLHSAESDAGLNANVVVSGNDVKVEVTGIPGITITWTGMIKLQKVS